MTTHTKIKQMMNDDESFKDFEIFGQTFAKQNKPKILPSMNLTHTKIHNSKLFLSTQSYFSLHSFFIS